jgi:membrane-bound lytic murein transglycosylase D
VFESPLVITLALVLSGCQLTASNSDTTANNDVEQQLNGASPSDVNDALMINAQYQQVADLDEPPPVFDDVWERIRYQLSIDVPQNRPVVAERNYYARHQAYLE